MNKTILSAWACSILFFGACTSESKQATTNEVAEVAQPTKLPPPVLTKEVVDSPGASASTTPVTQKGITGGNPYANLKGLNPAHGEPNHRCDIQVGEPLNLPPKATPNGSQQVVPVQPNLSTPQPSFPAAAPSVPIKKVEQTAPGFSGKPNPPHGQPGHRCDIQEGDILP